MPLTPGSKLSYYELLAPLGAGAMGEVWRAKDTRLDREVAIKVLPDQFASDAERLYRFEREAKALAALNHANVAQIFGVDHVAGAHFLVLELVPGESLEERLQRGPLRIAEAIDVCRQIADGLEAAHEAGVIHRDLKPANVCLTPDGKVKVLDFGLAKPAREALSDKTTDSVLTTEAGRLLGTPTYMAPEQARGRPIDKRVDIWAFGCVLYECLTAKRAFAGETLTDVFAAVLDREPDLAKLPAATPPRVRELLQRCFAKDPRARLRDIGEARLQLGRGDEPTSALAAAAAGRGSRLPWILCAVLAVASSLLLLRPVAQQSPPTPVRSSLRLPTGASLDLETNLGEAALLAISPDGSRVAYVATTDGRRRLHLRALDSFETTVVQGSEDSDTPFFSPDGSWVAFVARGRLFKAAVAGGEPIDLCEAQIGRGGAFGPDGTIVFPSGFASGLMKVSSTGGPSEVLTELDEAAGDRSHRWPVFLPGGREVAYTVGVKGQSNRYDDCQIDAVDIRTGKKRHLGLRASFVRPTPDGRLLCARNGQVFAVRLADLGQDRAVNPELILQGVAGVGSSGVAHFDVANDGTLVYAANDQSGSDYDLAWVTRSGEVSRFGLPPRRYLIPRLSPDGTRIAVTIQAPQHDDQDVWLYDLQKRSMTRLTTDGHTYHNAWTPDGRSLVSLQEGGGPLAIVRRSVDGGPAEVVHQRQADCWPLECSPDGKDLLFVSDSGAPNFDDLYAVSFADKQERVILGTRELEHDCAFSPDGRWLTVSTSLSSTHSLSTLAWPDGGGHWPVTDSGATPCWSRDGKELFYTQSTTMIGVPVTSEPSLVLGEPKKLFTLEFSASYGVVRNWDVAADGRFLVVLRCSSESNSDHIELVQHAFSARR
ncbi:MAG: protein kinase [Planctomycetota bacterium]